MYTPFSFVENDLSILHSCIEENSFATLVTTDAEGPAVSHLPLLLDRETGPNGTLIGHMAKANPQWREIASGDALAVFHGPHTYIWLLYPTDAADEPHRVELGGRRINKKKQYRTIHRNTIPTM